MHGKKRTKNRLFKGQKFQKTLKPALWIMTILLITVLASVAAYAIEGRTDSDAGAGSMNYYQQEIAGAGGSALGSVGADGQAHYSYQIGAVSLNYSSGSDWSVGGYSLISRSVKKGVPKYDDSPTGGEIFELDGEELVYIGTGSDQYGAYREYRTKRESFQKVNFYLYGGLDSFWVVFKPDGSRAIYLDQMYAEGGNSELHHGLPRAWAISIVESRGGYDRAGYFYLSYEGAYYLHKVINGKVDGSPKRYMVTILTWAENTDYQKKYSYRTGSRILHDGYILQRVEKYMGTNVHADLDSSGNPISGQLAEGCRLEYYENQQTFTATGQILVRKRKPLIKKIFGYGTDRETPRPPVTFSYNSLNLEMAPEAEKKVYTMDEMELRAASVRDRYDDIHSYTTDFMDINGDGLPDRVSQWRDQNSRSIWLNNGDGFTPIPDQTADGQPLRVTNGPNNVSNYHTAYDYFDINGDGLPDRIRKDWGDQVKVQLNTGSGFAAETPWPGSANSYLRSNVRNGNQYNLYVDYLDMNGDGLADMVDCGYTAEPNPIFKVYLNTGNGIATDYISWGSLDLSSLPIFSEETLTYKLRHVDFSFDALYVDDFGSNIGGQLMDINGDGLPDYVIKRGSEREEIDPRSRLIVFYNNGRSFESPEEWNVTDNRCLVDMDGQIFHNYIHGDGFDYIDMNDDGLPDRVSKTITEVMVNQGGGTVLTITNYYDLKVWFNNGNGFDPEHSYMPAPTDKYLLRQDMICSPSGFENEKEFTGVFADYIDINGDGFPDRLVKAPPRILVEGEIFWVAAMGLPNTNGDLHVYLNKAASQGPPDLLEAIDNGQGGTTCYGYEPLNKADNPHCKPAMWVVTSVKVKDGIGNCELTTYQYSDGVYDPLEKEFRGFGEVKTTEPTGNISVTNYYTDKDKKGLVNCVNYYKPGDSSSYLISSIGYSYNEPVFTVSGNDQIKFISLARKFETTQGEEITTEYQYDAYGNVTKIVETESYNNDQRITQNWYNIITSGSDYNNWNLRQLKESTVVGYDISRVFRLQGGVYHIYDSSGNPTHSYKWQEGTTPYPVGGDGTIATRPSGSDSRWVLQERRYYDSYGNVNQVKDARGNSAYTTYDTKYGVFPVKTVNALNHTTWNYYDYYGSEYDVDAISRQITLGRLTKTVFENTGLYTSQYYDSFGRVTKKVRMDYSENCPTEEISYTDAVIRTDGSGNIQIPASVAVKKRPLPEPEGPDNRLICSYTYVDGRGRTIQTKTSHGDGQYTTVGTRYYIFNDKIETHNDVPFLTATPEFTLGGANQSVFTTSRYDADQGWVSTITGSDWSVTATAKKAWTTTVTDPLNNVRNSYSNGFGQTLRVIEPDGAMTDYFYETGSGNLVEIKDHSGNKTRFVYDTLGRKVKEIDPDLGTTTCTYDANGNRISKTDANRQTVAYEYDGLNRLTKTTYPGTGNTDVFIYDNDNDPGFDEGYAIGQLVRTDISRNNTVREIQRFRYDRYGNVTLKNHQVEDKVKEIGYQYDGLGRTVSATYPGQDMFLYQYHPSGAGIQNIMLPTGMPIVSGAQYTPSGKISGMDLNGTNPFSINYEYFEYFHVGADLLKRISTSAGVGGFDLNYGYDRNGNVLRINDAAIPNHNQYFAYDSRNRLVQADGNGMYGLKNYSYDQIGNMTVMEERAYLYNLGEMRSKPHAVKLTTESDGFYIFKYDAAGNMVEKRLTGGFEANLENLIVIPMEILNYDIYGLEQVTLNGQAELKTANGSYGAVGSRGQVQLGQNAKTGAITATGNIVLQNSSGVYGDIETVGSVSAGNGVFVGGITYNETWVNTPNISILNNIDFTGVPQTTISVYSGQSRTLAPGKYWNCDVSGELKLTPGIYYFNSLQMYMNSKLTLDEANGPIKIYVQNTLMMQAGTFHSLAGKNGTKSLLIGYLGTQNVYMGGAASFGGTVVAPRANLYLGDGSNKVYEGMFIGKQVQLNTSAQVTCVPFVGLTPQIRHYKYDWNNQLVEVQHNYQTIMTSEYGATNNRIKKSENGTDTYYFFAEYEEDWNGGTLTGSAKYLFANGKRVAKANAAGEFCYYVGDHLGSNTLVVDDSLNVDKTMKYKPYGGMAFESGTRNEDYRFNDKEQDATGLYYYGARFYDPNLGRFITADPVTPGGGFDPQGLNRYSYCLNNPVKYVDPSGNEPEDTLKLWKFQNGADNPYSGIDFIRNEWAMSNSMFRLMASYGFDENVWKSLKTWNSDKGSKGLLASVGKSALYHVAAMEQDKISFMPITPIEIYSEYLSLQSGLGAPVSTEKQINLLAAIGAGEKPSAWKTGSFMWKHGSEIVPIMHTVDVGFNVYATGINTNQAIKKYGQGDYMGGTLAGMSALEGATWAVVFGAALYALKDPQTAAAISSWAVPCATGVSISRTGVFTVKEVHRGEDVISRAAKWINNYTGQINSAYNDMVNEMMYWDSDEW